MALIANEVAIQALGVRIKFLTAKVTPLPAILFLVLQLLATYQAINFMVCYLTSPLSDFFYILVSYHAWLLFIPFHLEAIELNRLVKGNSRLEATDDDLLLNAVHTFQVR